MAHSSEQALHLRVGGLTRLTTIDYPGELAAVIFCQGCPWRCRYCHNVDLLDASAPARISWPDIYGFLEQRVELLDGVVFSGGEPMAQHALAAAMTEVRALGFKIGLHTGGAYPQRLRQLLPLLDWVGLDIKALPADYDAITGVAGSGKSAWESLDILLAARVPMEVRTTLMPDWTPEQVAGIAQTLAGKGVRDYSLQACDTAHALDRHLAPAHRSLQDAACKVDAGRFERLTLRGR